MSCLQPEDSGLLIPCQTVDLILHRNEETDLVVLSCHYCCGYGMSWSCGGEEGEGRDPLRVFIQSKSHHCIILPHVFYFFVSQ